MAALQARKRLIDKLLHANHENGCDYLTGFLRINLEFNLPIRNSEKKRILDKIAVYTDERKLSYIGKYLGMFSDRDVIEYLSRKVIGFEKLYTLGLLDRNPVFEYFLKQYPDHYIKSHLEFNGVDCRTDRENKVDFYGKDKLIIALKNYCLNGDISNLFTYKQIHELLSEYGNLVTKPLIEQLAMTYLSQAKLEEYYQIKGFI